MGFLIRDESVISSLRALAERKGRSMEEALLEAVSDRLAVIEKGDVLRLEVTKLKSRHRRLTQSRKTIEINPMNRAEAGVHAPRFTACRFCAKVATSS